MIKLEHINKSFGSLHAVKDANLNVEKGEIICLIGPSGSGKSRTTRAYGHIFRWRSHSFVISE